MIPMNTRCSREQVRHPIPNSSLSKEDSSSMSASTSNTNISKTMLDTPTDPKPNRVKENRIHGLYLSESDYRIPDLNTTYDSIDQSSIKSVGTDGVTVTTGTTVHVSNGMTARLKKIFQRKLTRKQQGKSKASIPQSIQTFDDSRKKIMNENSTVSILEELREKSGIRDSRDAMAIILRNARIEQSTAPTVRIEEEDDDDDDDDVRDRSREHFSERTFTLSFVKNLFECCTTDEDVFSE